MITLEGEGGSLLMELAINELGWTRLYLVAPGKKVYLGADTRDVLLSRLLGWLDSPSEGLPFVGFLQRPAAWVLSLSEAHHVLYGGCDGSDRLLFFWNAQVSGGRLEGVIRLSPEQQDEWRLSSASP